ncbi:hypothetical protein C0995_009719 [Termitomyces sp. Mi166|nr:hypothetical protein C0995_009719 [Termitomyces sp. Mi166\
MTALYTEPPTSYPESPGPTASVYAESLAHRRPLSIGLDVPQSSSPFPSPSSSFLPPPIPDNHEFAMRSPYSGCPASKGSIVDVANGGLSGTVNGNGSLSGNEDEAKTPLPTEPERKLEALSESSPSPASTVFESRATPIPPLATPTPRTTPTSASEPPVADSTSPTLHPAAPAPAPAATTPTASSITIPSTSMMPSTNPLTPNRPAPPSPAASRRVSSMSTFSTRSPVPTTSTNVSRANSIRRSSRLSANTSAHMQAQFSASVVLQIQSSTPRVLIHVRDFAFDKTDERFRGAGALVPRANHLAVLHRKLAGMPDDDDDEESENEADGEDINAAWDKLRGGWSLNGWSAYSNSPVDGQGPTREEMDLNFGGAGEEEYEDEGGEVEEPLYPGLYRAAYAFVPEGTAEMALVEDQVVRVVGRGGGVGWAVVVDENAGLSEDGEPRHALVPESYLEVVRLDWEDEPEEEAI